MTLMAAYRDARRDEELARLRRVLALRAMVATGLSQRAIAAALGITQPAVSQQLKAGRELAEVPPETLLQAAAPVLSTLALERGFSRLALFGSLARREGRPGSDIDLLVQPPDGTSSFDFVRFQQLIEEVLGREIDLVSYGGLRPELDEDVLRDAVPL